MDTHAFRQLLRQVGGLPQQQRAQLGALLRDGLARDETNALIEAVRATGLACPRCGARHLHRHGHRHGLQRYRCAACARTFNALTGTPLARLQHRAKWLPYLGTMLRSSTVRHAAKAVGVHRNTSFRWRHRFLARAKDDRLVPLEGMVEADETYLLESQKGSRRLTRPPRKRGGAAKRRGVNHEHDCILVARDRSGRTVDAVTGRAPLKAAHLTRHLAPVLAAPCVLVTDGHPAYRAFARSSGLAHRAVNLSAGVRVDGDAHVQNVNAYHSRFKQWLQPFHGVASRYLANYLGWRWAVDGERIGSPEALLRAALWPGPHFPQT